MSVFENPNFDDHESVHHFHDSATGLYAIIAVHSTHRGPSAGGTRFWGYAKSEAAVTDVLRLSRGMSYKNALAGLSFGGGKAVVMKPSGAFNRESLFQAYGRAVDSLGGRYVTAADVGMSLRDMQIVRTQTRYVAGLTDGEEASGDPAPVTADGILRSIRLAAHMKLGKDKLKGVRVAVQGLGHVGYNLCKLLHTAGARLVVTDINKEVLSQAVSDFDAVIVAPDDIYDADVDIFAPCALGAVINPETIDRLTCSVIAGAANNQLSTPDMGLQLKRKGVLYCPDYIINAGGIINIAGEIRGDYDLGWVEEKLCGIEETLCTILTASEKTGRPANLIANEMAQERIGRKPIIKFA